MDNISGLQRLREERFFRNWEGFVVADWVEASEANLRQLLDDLIALGPKMSEESARQAVEDCVIRFNDLDRVDEKGWIFTIEREDIYEQIGRVIDVCGFEYGEDWGSERDW